MRQLSILVPALLLAAAARSAAAEDESSPVNCGGMKSKELRKWLAARDPETGGAAVQRVSMIAACGAGEALCALAVNRKESVAQRKLQAEDYRDEMELAAEVIAAEDLLERWHAGAGALGSPK